MLHVRLKEIREKLGFSQKEMAKFMNVTLRAYQRYETGEQKPSYEKLVALLNELKVVNPTWLLTGEGSMFREPSEKASSLSEKIPANLLKLLENRRFQIILEYLSEVDEETVEEVFALLQKEKRRKEEKEALLKELEALKKSLKAA